MDPVPPDGKRLRLASWPASTSATHGPPPPHSLVHTSSTTQLPPPPPQRHPPPHLPPASPAHHHHLPAPISGPPPHQHPPYPPRGPHISSAPPTPVTPVSSSSNHQPDLERRHHEPELYAPMQDYYRQLPPQHHQPPSPAHPPYQPFTQLRDSSVKREQQEDHRRLSSAGHVQEAHSAIPSSVSPSSHQSSLPAQPDHQARHMNYDNGHPMPPTPGGYRHPSYPPPTPIAHQPTYESHTPYGSAPEPFYYSSSIPAAKKKNTRASQACDQCRQLKAKCDETKPCKTCRDKGTECRYRDPIPKATDKAQADILDGISAMQNSLSTLTEHMVRMDHRLTKIEGTGPKPTVVTPKTEFVPNENVVAPSAPFVPAVPAEPAPAPDYPPEVAPERPAAAHDPTMSIRMLMEDEMEVEPGPPVPPGEPAIPINHTTLAGLLLEWPPIRDMTKHHLEKAGVRFISEYPIGLEQSRGPLIVYGRGEDSHFARQAQEVADHGLLDITDDSSDVASSPSPADWGQLGGLSPPDAIEYKGGVLGFDGNPDFSEARVWTYVESFKDNILNMHPIIPPKDLNLWVRNFLDTLPTAHQKPTKSSSNRPAFAVGPGAQTPNEQPGAKRKRSPGPDGPDGLPTPSTARLGRPNRSIHSALILTVLALGKICLHRDSIPDVLHGTEQVQSNNSPMHRNGVLPSPGQGSPPNFAPHSHSSGLPSPKEHERGQQSRRSSLQGSLGNRSGYSLKKNYEVIPGLEYFALATDILGNQLGAYNNMKSVYANIFAGLYHGQLGRPLESFAFIHQASHKLQVIIRPSLDKLRRMKRNRDFIQEPRYNRLALAFWTCLQLESDLIAEMPLPPSGLLSYEDDMPHPNLSLLEGFSQRVLDSYPGQLYLRTHLNSIHRMFYSPEDPNQPGQDKFKNVHLVSDAVSGMHWVAPSFAFREDDPPADDILSARLRAKYWGAQMITNRPFIRQILQFSHSTKNYSSSPHIPALSEFREGIIAPVIHPNTRTISEIEPRVIELAQKGIKALIESTRAFHGLGHKRPVITNLFGTAHAQWGNLLVLCACFKDPVLSPYVDGELLQTLLLRTIQFLKQSSTATSSLRTDMFILEGLHRDLFMSHDTRTASSFSSTITQTPKMSAGSTPHIPAHVQMGPPTTQ